jgi:hypothetical protein
MELLIIGVAVAANILLILIKYERKRYQDATLDLILLLTVTVVFGGSFGGLVVSTIASAIISLYLLANPPKLNFDIQPVDTNSFMADLKSRFTPRYR